jgi:hypothetical protein
MPPRLASGGRDVPSGGGRTRESADSASKSAGGLAIASDERPGLSLAVGRWALS